MPRLRTIDAIGTPLSMAAQRYSDGTLMSPVAHWCGGNALQMAAQRYSDGALMSPVAH